MGKTGKIVAGVVGILIVGGLISQFVFNKDVFSGHVSVAKPGSTQASKQNGYETLGDYMLNVSSSNYFEQNATVNIKVKNTSDQTIKALTVNDFEITLDGQPIKDSNAVIKVDSDNENFDAGKTYNVKITFTLPQGMNQNNIKILVKNGSSDTSLNAFTINS